MNKSVVTNVVAAAIAVLGLALPESPVILMTGLFALSGGVTNWLAVHMLFERVPFLYGSGVIPSRFDEFKSGIKTLIVQEFFSREHIARFVTDSDAFSGGAGDPVTMLNSGNGIGIAFNDLALHGITYSGGTGTWSAQNLDDGSTAIDTTYMIVGQID